MNDAGRLTPEVLQRYAELGAQARFEQLRNEITALLAAFPNLDPDMGRLGAVLYQQPPAPAAGVTLPAARAAYRERERVKRRRRRRVEATPPGVTMPAKRRRRKMSADARLAVSARMKKYWAGRRKEQRGSNNGATAH